ncbi:Iron/zinc purple acid phosphatase-like protein [Aphelenchoides besseyi]|nr:Iron/zinc purple acid phosphatase-like protein [Aphelenchoides besseyi]
MRTIRIFGSIFVHLIFVASNGWAFPLPEQIHLSLGDHPNSMVIQWVTFDLGHGPPYVDFGFEKDRFISRLYADMETFVFEGITRYMYTAELKNLEYNTTYYYQVGSDHFMSSIYDFQTFPSGTDFSYRVCIFGDLGVENGVSSSYDLHTNKGLVGDEFMRGMESIAARFPYLVIAGNHEDDGRNYSNYVSRFNMPNDPFYDNQVYRFFYEYGHLPVLNQYQWLENDLRKANANREKTPFLIGYYHRPLYCSNVNSFECHSFENTLVSFVTNKERCSYLGHEHSYERFYPIYNRQVFNQTTSPYYNAAAPTYIVTGRCHSPHAGYNSSALTPGSAFRFLKQLRVLLDERVEEIREFWFSECVKHNEKLTAVEISFYSFQSLGSVFQQTVKNATVRYEFLPNFFNDEYKHFLEFSDSSSSCNHITLGVGGSWSGEIALRRKYPQCKMLGVDPVESLSRAVVESDPNSRFILAAVGETAKKYVASIKCT